MTIRDLCDIILYKEVMIMIDLMELRQDIKNGDYIVFISHEVLSDGDVYLKDKENGECILLLKVDKDGK